MTASERRQAILEVLSVRRYETRYNLAFEFSVNEKTIRRDIEILSLDYPIYTTQGQGGGIHVADNFKLGKSYPSPNISTQIIPSNCPLCRSERYFFIVICDIELSIFLSRKLVYF